MTPDDITTSNVADDGAPMEPETAAIEPAEVTEPAQAIESESPTKSGFTVDSSVKMQFKSVAADGTETVTTLDDRAAKSALIGIVLLIVGIMALGVAVIWWIFQL